MENLDIIRHFVTSVARKEGLSEEEEIHDIELAVDEASMNVIEHAYGGRSHQQIHIAVRIDCHTLTVLITDQGRGFNPRAVKLPNKRQDYLARLRAGGLGIFLMKKLMDEVDYSTPPGSKNQVRIVKYTMKPRQGQRSQPT